MQSTIYVLVDPRRKEEYRYVGKTGRSLSARLSGHLGDAKKSKSTHKTHWIRKLLRERVVPAIISLEVVDPALENEREIYWIDKLKKEGHKLTNSTNGGDRGVEYTEEVRRKISKALSGENNPNYGKRGEGTPMFGKTHSKELKDKMSKKWTGKGNPKYGKGDSIKGENNPFYGKCHSEETKHKISVSNRGKPGHMKGKHHSEETKQKLRDAAKERLSLQANPMQGKHHSEETKLKISKKAKERWAKKSPIQRQRSEETKEKIRQAKKRYWAEKSKKSA